MSLDGIDFSTIYVYDTASGTLVAVVGYGDPGVFGCTAGPSCVAPPSCGSHQTVTCPVDAGTEAASDGAIGDAGGD
jgi:precorrin-3B methylase